MKVTIIGRWSNHAPCDASKIRGNVSSTVIVSDPVDNDRLTMDILGAARTVYVIDHVRKQFELLGSRSDVFARSITLPDRKILCTIELDEAALQSYDALTTAINSKLSK